MAEFKEHPIVRTIVEETAGGRFIAYREADYGDGKKVKVVRTSGHYSTKEDAERILGLGLEWQRIAYLSDEVNHLNAELDRANNTIARQKASNKDLSSELRKRKKIHGPTVAEKNKRIKFLEEDWQRLNKEKLKAYRCLDKVNAELVRLNARVSYLNSLRNGEESGRFWKGKTLTLRESIPWFLKGWILRRAKKRGF